MCVCVFVAIYIFVCLSLYLSHPLSVNLPYDILYICGNLWNTKRPKAATRWQVMWHWWFIWWQTQITCDTSAILSEIRRKYVIKVRQERPMRLINCWVIYCKRYTFLYMTLSLLHLSFSVCVSLFLFACLPACLRGRGRQIYNLPVSPSVRPSATAKHRSINRSHNLLLVYGPTTFSHPRTPKSPATLPLSIVM